MDFLLVSGDGTRATVMAGLLLVLLEAVRRVRDMFVE